jgi:hypothetical protein
MSFKELKPELMELQTTWGSQIQAAKAPKGTEGAPFPVKILLEMEQPAACSHWDVEWLKVLLIVDGPELVKEALPLRVEFPQLDLPLDMRELMAAMTLAQWKASIIAGSTDGVALWHLQETLSWAQANFDTLLRVIPKCVDWYMGADKNDVSQRRYTITPQVEVIPPTPVVKKKAPVKEDTTAGTAGNGAPVKGSERVEENEQDRATRIREQQEDERYKLGV